MHRLLLQSVILITSFSLFAAKTVTDKPQAKENENVIISKEWTLSTGVKKIFETPLGTVYELQTSLEPDVLWAHARYHKRGEICKACETNKTQFFPLQIRLFKNDQEVRQNHRRFVVIDFQARKFPASPRQDSTLRITFIRSGLDYMTDLKNVNAYCNGIVSGNNSSFKSAAQTKIFYNNTDANKNGANYWGQQLFNPVSYRLIIDTVTGGIISFNEDGHKFIKEANESFADSAPIRSIGVCLAGKRDNHLLEISKPVITLIDSEEELQKLKPVMPGRYSYGEYPSDWNKIKNMDNPDALYSYAMRLLEGNGVQRDFVRSLELLKKAAGRHHVFAMYQLGVCYYRGIGTEPNLDLAMNWLRQAGDAYLEDAMALYNLILWRKNFPDIRDTTYKTMSGIDAKILELGKRGYNASLLDTIKPVYSANTHSPGCWPVNFGCHKDLSVLPKLSFYVGRTFFPVQPWRETRHQIIVNGRTLKDGDTVPVPVQSQTEELFVSILNNKGGPAVQSAQWIDQAITMNYAPAMLYKGLKLVDSNAYKGAWQNEASPESAMNLFERGAKLGDPDCRLEILLLKARDGTLKSADITAEEITLRDSAMYYVLRYCFENSTQPGSIDFLKGNYASAISAWKVTTAGWNAFCLGAIDFYNYQRQMFLSVNLHNNQESYVKQLKALVELWQKAANSGVVPAQYLLGKIYLQGNSMSINRTMGMELMQKAAKAGFAGAQLVLAEATWDSYKNRKDALAYLTKPCEADIPEAWQLAAEIQGGSETVKTVDALNKAAKLGSIRALHELGMACYYGKYSMKKDLTQAAAYWDNFYKLDTERRNQDVNDFYWGFIKTPKLLLDSNGLPLRASCTPVDLPVATVKKYYDTY